MLNEIKGPGGQPGPKQKTVDALLYSKIPNCQEREASPGVDHSPGDGVYRAMTGAVNDVTHKNLLLGSQVAINCPGTPIKSGVGGAGGGAPRNRLDYSTTSRHPEDPNHEYMTLFCVACGYQHRIMLNCGDRTCEVCRRKWFGTHYNKIIGYVEKWKRPITVCLTLKNIPDTEFNKGSVKQLRGYFNKLRHRKDFKTSIKGGFYMIQVTNDGNGWHLHMHIIYDGLYIPKEALVNAWREITGGSYIVDIGEAKKPARAVAYLLSDFSGTPRIREQDKTVYNDVFKRSRLVQAFGCYARTKMSSPYKCPSCGGSSWRIIIDMRRRIKRFVGRAYDTS